MNVSLTQPQAPSQLSSAVQSIDQRIQNAQADSMLRAIPAVVFISMIAAAGLWSVFYYLSGHTGTLIWAAIMHPIQLFLLLSQKYFKTGVDQPDPEYLANRYCTILALIGVTWGLAPWMLLPHENIILASFMAIILLGVNAVALIAWAAYRPAIYSTSIPLFIGLIAALFWQGESENLISLIALSLFLLATAGFSMVQNHNLGEALRSRFEQEDLIKQLAQQVQLTEHANQEKTRFLASASHDLRQPLHSIALFGTALQEKLKSTADAPLARSLMICVEALESSFTSMLDISKLDAGTVTPHLQPVSLATLFQQLDNDYRRQAEGRGLALRFKPGGKWTKGDPVLLKRMLGNLIHNALKFTQKGGAIVVARTRNANLSVEVWDTGSGIETEQLPRIFDEFYQLENPERDRGKGLGMGLSIVKRLAYLMDLRLEVHSVVGRGTVFKIQMPLAPPPIQQKSSLPRYVIKTPTYGLAGKSILIVDDEESVRNSTAEILRLHDMNVEIADGITQALEIVQRPGQVTDMIITDLRLREQEDGLQLVAEVNKCLGHELPALLITGDVAPERVHLVQHSGLKVLYKPIKVDDLLEALHALLV